VAARVSRLSRHQQAALTRKIKRARQLALLPVSDRHRTIRDLT
jgi:ribosomal protein S18